MISMKEWVDETMTEGFTAEEVMYALCDGEFLEAISPRVHVDEESVKEAYDHLQALI